MTSASQVLNLNARTLLERGAHTRTLCQLAKLVGLLAALSGGVSIATNNVNPGAAAVTLGAALYVGAVGKELSTTGKVMPVPFFDADIGMLARQGTTQGETAERLTETDYLSMSERAKLAMATTLKPMTLALDELPEDEQATAYHMLANGLVQMYSDELKHIDILPALLPDMGGMTGVQERLTHTLPPAHRATFASAALPEVLPPEPQTAQIKAAAPRQTQRKSAEPTAQYAPVKQRRESAIEVPSRTVNNQLDNHHSPAAATLGITAYVSLQHSPFTSRAWFGGQRTGKSYLAAVTSKGLHEKHGTRVFHINLASFGLEDSYYWSHVDQWDSVCCDITEMDIPSAKHQISAAVRLVHEFYATENALLIVDEYAYIGSKINQHSEALEELLHVIADKIATLSSTGIKRRKALWALCPEYVAGAMVKDALAIKKLGLVFCAIAPGHKACWKDSAGQNHALSFDWALYEMVSRNFSIQEPPRFSPHARTVFVDGQWLSGGLTGDELS